MSSLDHELKQLGTTRWSIRDFDIGKPLGKGHSGKVYLARLKRDDFLVVLKCVTKDLLVTEGGEHQIRREIEIMQNTRHLNILRLYGWFHDANRVFLILEYAGGGEMFKHLRKAGRFSERRSSRYIAQVADGLAYLHSKNIIHRDIKPENLLLGADDSVKICDFGWSVHTAGVQQTLAGTLSYVPPEMIMGQAYGKAVDIWALGVLTYEFICGTEPFAGQDQRDTQSRICRVDLCFPTFVSDTARNFIMQILRLRPDDRLPLHDVPQHLWINP